MDIEKRPSEVRFTPQKRTFLGAISMSGQKRTRPLQQKLALVDDLVGDGKHRLRNCQAQCFGGLEVDSALDFLGLLDW
jgi:hypothetical protein